MNTTETAAATEQIKQIVFRRYAAGWQAAYCYANGQVIDAKPGAYPTPEILLSRVNELHTWVDDLNASPLPYAGHVFEEVVAYKRPFTPAQLAAWRETADKIIGCSVRLTTASEDYKGNGDLNMAAMTASHAITSLLKENERLRAALSAAPAPAPPAEDSEAEQVRRAYVLELEAALEQAEDKPRLGKPLPLADLDTVRKQAAAHHRCFRSLPEGYTHEDIDRLYNWAEDVDDFLYSLSRATALSAAPAPAPAWVPVTSFEQVQDGDTLLVVGNMNNVQHHLFQGVKKLPGTEEVLLRKKDNKYFIFSLYLSGESWVKECYQLVLPTPPTETARR